jgi:AraC-like DNA-binding protein
MYIKTVKNDIKMYEKGSIEILHAKSQQSLPLHSHECFCFGVVLGGEADFTIGGIKRPLRAGMTFLIPSNTGVTIDTPDGYSYITICLKNEIKDRLMQYSYNDFFPQGGDKASYDDAARDNKADRDPAGENTADSINDICVRFIEDGCEERFLDSIAEYIYAGADKRQRRASDDRDRDIFVQGAEYIKAHLTEKFELDELSSYVHVSKYHFIRVFKKYAGVTPNQYYNQAKLFKVKQKLRGDEKESDVAADLNFPDQSYLCNMFKRHMGISMKDFKNNIRSI